MSTGLRDGHDRPLPVASAEWITASLAAAGACVWCWDAATARVSYTPGAETLLGGTPSTLDELDVLTDEHDRAARRRERAGALDRRDRWVVSFRIAGAPGERWVEERGRACVDADGRVAAAVALVVDVTARQRSEEQLERRLTREARERSEAESAMGAVVQAESFLESIVASMVDGLVLYDRDGRVTRMNPAAHEMLGEAAEGGSSGFDETLADLRVTDVEGRPIAPDQLPAFAALRGNVVRGVPLAFLRPDGRKVWATVGAAPIRGPDGAIVGAVLSLGDVSRLRDLQEQREDLSRMISHDLRAPLGVILGHAKLLGRRAEGADALRARAEAIGTSAQRMAAMLNDLVESALLEAGKLRLLRAPVDIAGLVRSLRTRLPAPLEGDRIRLEIGEGAPRVLGDPDRLERVFLNLLTNALKYSAPGTDVTVRVARHDGHVVLEVEDRGAGIAPEDVPHLFERYYRGEGSAQFEGMGLGLYIARMLVEAHGGTVTVSSVLGQGSTFHVRLPACPDPA